jgi:sugar porter (SP) family MFS transporter
MQKSKLIFWSITAALAGFLFGFDTIVISGAEQAFQKLWQLNEFWHGLATGMALWGTVIGAIFGGYPAAKYGRRRTLIAIGFLYFVSAVGSGLAPEVISFMIARFIGGLGVGAATVAAPMFISEISPPESRGKLAGMFQFNIVFGILIALVSNTIFGNLMEVESAWRWMLGIEAVPALIYTLMSFSLPESPRWLITHAGRLEEGADVFRQINPEAPEEDIQRLVAEVKASAGDASKTKRFWTPHLKIPILLAFLIAFFNQFSGINIVFYFAPRLLGLAGLKNTLLAAVSLGVTNLIFTFIGLWLIDRLGRRSLLYIGSVGYILSLGICAWAFFSTPTLKVASAAKDLADSAGALVTYESGERYISEMDKQAVLERGADRYFVRGMVRG